MNNRWPISVFIEEIEDRCTLQATKNRGDEVIRYYLSSDNSTSVAINTTDEFMTTRTAQDLLTRLKLRDLIERKYNYESI